MNRAGEKAERICPSRSSAGLVVGIDLRPVGRLDVPVRRLGATPPLVPARSLALPLPLRLSLMRLRLLLVETRLGVSPLHPGLAVGGLTVGGLTIGGLTIIPPLVPPGSALTLPLASGPAAPSTLLLTGLRVAGGTPIGPALRLLLDAGPLLGLALRLLLRLLAGAGALLGAAGADRGDALLERDLEALRRLRLIVEPLDRPPREARADRALDGEQLGGLLFRDEVEGVAHHLGPGGAADPVDVVLGDVGDVEVDHVRERLDVDAAGRDVGRHQHQQVAALEAGQGVGALRLAAVAVDALAGDAVLLEELGEPVRPVLGAGEDEDVLDLPAAASRREDRPSAPP